MALSGCAESLGQVTVSDYLRDLAVNSASSWADNFAYGAWGGGGIALRGLSEKYTLVPERAEHIGQLNVSPELLQTLLGREPMSMEKKS